nr:MAG TPA: hypothetical protein [Caudoviricetes sp.]
MSATSCPPSSFTVSTMLLSFPDSTTSLSTFCSSTL